MNGDDFFRWKEEKQTERPGCVHFKAFRCYPSSVDRYCTECFQKDIDKLKEKKNDRC